MSTATSPRVVRPGNIAVRIDSSPKPFKRWGGFVMTHDTTVRWAARILKKEVSELTKFEYKAAAIYPMERVRKFGFSMCMVGTKVDVHHTHDMLITQEESFMGRKDMLRNFPDPRVPEFVEGQDEEDAVKVLTAYGIDPSEYVFQTIIG